MAAQNTFMQEHRSAALPVELSCHWERCAHLIQLKCTRYYIVEKLWRQAKFSKLKIIFGIYIRCQQIDFFKWGKFECLTGTSCEKCNSKASGWESNPRPWISRPTLYRLSYRSRCSELGCELCIYLYIYIYKTGPRQVLKCISF